MATASLYTGKTVKIKQGGKVVSGKVIDIGDGEFCIEFANGSTKWVKNSTLVS